MAVKGEPRLAGFQEFKRQAFNKVDDFSRQSLLAEAAITALPGAVIGGLTGGIPGALMGGVVGGLTGRNARQRVDNALVETISSRRANLPSLEKIEDLQGLSGSAASVIGAGAGIAAGLVPGTFNLMFGGNEPQQANSQMSMAQPNQPPAGMSQSVPQVQVPVLNEEQIKKAQKRAQEQAALNAFYAQQLGQYGE